MSRPRMWGQHVADGWWEIVDAETRELFQIRKPCPATVKPVPGQYPDGDYLRAIYIDEDATITQAISRADGSDNPIPLAVLRRVVEACDLLLAQRNAPTIEEMARDGNDCGL